MRLKKNKLAQSLFGIIVVVLWLTANPCFSQNIPRNEAIRGFNVIYGSTKANNSALDSSRNRIKTEAAIGDSIPVYYASVDKIRIYSVTADPNEAIEFGNELIFILRLNSLETVGLIVKKRDNEWHFSGTSKQDFSRFMDSIYLSKRVSLRKEDIFLLRIPSLYLTFMASKSSTGISLVSLTNSTTYRVEKGGSYDASSLFIRLASILKDKNIKFLSPKDFKPKKN